MYMYINDTESLVFKFSTVLLLMHSQLPFHLVHLLQVKSSCLAANAIAATTVFAQIIKIHFNWNLGIIVFKMKPLLLLLKTGLVYGFVTLFVLLSHLLKRSMRALHSLGQP